jgi:predicted phosphodiesterase
MTLAKKAYKDEPLLFNSIEEARAAIRYYRGSKGDRSRKNPTNITKPLGWQGQLPESSTNVCNIWNLPKAYKKVLVLSDIHIPFHDVNALQAALDYGRSNNVDAVFLNGDILDFYQLSFHEKDPRKVSIADELEAGREFLKYLKHNFSCPIYFIKGNHEYRLERYLRLKAPELLDIQDFELKVLLRFGENGVIEIPYGSKVYLGKLLLEHGDKMRGSGGVQPARTLLLKFKRAVMCGHFHRHSEATQKVYDGDLIKAWSLGCLCELEPDYMPVNDWSHGAAIVEVDHKTGHFHVNNFQIINGRIF